MSILADMNKFIAIIFFPSGLVLGGGIMLWAWIFSSSTDSTATSVAFRNTKGTENHIPRTWNLDLLASSLQGNPETLETNRERGKLADVSTFLFSADGPTMVSSGRLGLGLGDSHELKKDWIKGSRFCPFWKNRNNHSQNRDPPAETSPYKDTTGSGSKGKKDKSCFIQWIIITMVNNNTY